NFGDGSPTSTDSAPQHTYVAQGGYSATLTVSDGRLPTPGTDTVTVPITVGTLPVVTIIEPTTDLLFQGGQSIDLASSAMAVEDRPLPPSALHWEIRFHHADHWHPFLHDLPGSPQSFVTAATGHTETDVSYWIILRATDSSGLPGESELFLHPPLVPLRLETSPPGLQLTLDGQPVTTPVAAPGIVGIVRTLGAPSQGANTFVGWSDGGVQVHTISTPAGGGTYTAFFTGPAPTTTSTSITTTVSTTSSTVGTLPPTTSTTLPPRCDASGSPAAIGCRLEVLREEIVADAQQLGRLADGPPSRPSSWGPPAEGGGTLWEAG